MWDSAQTHQTCLLHCRFVLVPNFREETADMLNRRNFVRSSLVAGGGLALAAELASVAPAALAQDRKRYVDRLTDDTGKYAAAPLPYAFDALEPAIDARTVELHYTFHHKP